MMEDFLRERQFPEDKLQEMKSEKIDETCVELMSEEQLKQYVPKYGDRLAVRGFVSKMKTRTTQMDRKHSLLERLRCKLQKKSPEEQPEPTSKLTKLSRKSAAEKPYKKVGIGMMMFDMKEQCYHQLRVKSGGGTRTISVSKFAKKDDLLIEGRQIFFPNNISPRYGSADEYHFDIMDYQGIPLDNTVTVQDVSDITKLSNLRFYLAVKCVSNISDVSTGSEIPTTGSQSVNDLTFETTASTSSLTSSGIPTTGSQPVNDLTFETTASTSSLTSSGIPTTGSQPVNDLTFETTASTSSLTSSGIPTTGSQPVNDLTFETTASTSSLTSSGIPTTGSQPVNDLTFETTASTSSLTSSGIPTTGSQPVNDLTFETTASTSSLTISGIPTTGSQPVNDLTFETTASTSSLTSSGIPTTGSQAVNDLTFETTASTSSLTSSGIPTTGSQPVNDLTFETTASTSSLTSSGIPTTGSQPVNDLTFETTASTSSLTSSGIPTTGSQPVNDLTFETTASTSLPDLSTETDIGMDMFLDQLDRHHGHEEEQHNFNHHIITLHRGHVFKELRRQFASGNFDLVFDMFTFEMILPNGEKESAEDSGGVIRDALVEFWESFYEECTLGREYKVPFLRHDYTPVDWNAIGRVLFFGWKEQKYFPVQLSKAFMSCCVYGMDTYASSQETLLKEFMSYIPLSEAKTIASSLEGDFDEDELLEILGNHECRVLPTPDNLKQVLGEIAHKELIQQPMYIKECWFNQLNSLGFDLGSTSLDSLYKKLIPDNRKVGKILRFPDDMSTTQTPAANFLKKLVRELEPDLLAQFLRFCTGSDLLLMDGVDDYKTISVRFTNLTGISRRPVAHTCGRVLEIPEHYDSYLEFRCEFMSVLKSNIWVMDFV